MANPTIALLDGFEHGLATSGTAGIYDTIAGSPANVTTPVRTGSRALEIATSAAQERVQGTIAAGNRVALMCFAIRFATLPTSNNIQLAGFVCGSNNPQIRWNSSTNRFRASVQNVNNADFGPNPVSTNTWYLIVLEADTSTGTRQARARCYDASTGALIGSTGTATDAIAAADLGSWYLGTVAAETFTAYYDDFILSLTDGDWEIVTDTTVPRTPFAVSRHLPTGDGTHNTANTANLFERTATGTDIIDSTTDAYLLVDEVPMDTTPTDYVLNVGNASAGRYIEVTLEDHPAIIGQPLAARGYTVDRDAVTTGTSAAISRVVLSDGTSVSPDLRLSTDDPGTTVTTRKKMLTAPSGGWDRDKVNGLKVRMGFGDSSPAVWFGSFLVEVANMGPTLIGALFTNAPSFFTGAITTTYALSGSLFTKAPSFFTGKTTIDVAGTLFQRAPTFFTGQLDQSAGVINLAGTLFQDAPSFPQGALIQQQFLSGVLFQRAPTFPTGALTSRYALAGTLFQRAPTFFAGKVSHLLPGTLFQRAPSFPQGAITSRRDLAGSLFSRAPTFFAGTVGRGAVNLAGTLFQRAPSFFVGVAGSGFLAGITFQRAPTFPTGTVTPGAVNLAGVLFQRSPTFAQGAITSTRNVSGVLFQRAPTFFTGLVLQQQRLTGSLFVKAPTFFAGKVEHVLRGVLFSRAPVFPAGSITSAYTISGQLFELTAFFPGGGSVLHQGNLLGADPLIEVPVFFVGTVAHFDYTPEWPAGAGAEWPVSISAGWSSSVGLEWPQPPPED